MGTCEINTTTASNKMCRAVLKRIIINHDNNKLIAYVNTGLRRVPDKLDVINRAMNHGRGGVDSNTCKGSSLGREVGTNRLRNSGRPRGSSSPSRRKTKRSENSWSERGGNFDNAGSRRRRTGAIGPVLCVRSAATPARTGHIAVRAPSHSNDGGALRTDW